MRLAEELSDLRERAGDHQEAAAVLLPVVQRRAGPLTAGEEVRLHRRLAIHLHRSGRVSEALEACSRVRALADPARDLEDLVLVASELAEIHTLRAVEAVLLRAMVALSPAESLGRDDLEPYLSAPGEEPRPPGEPRFPDDFFEGCELGIGGLEDLKLELERAYLLRLFRKLRGDLRKMMTVLGVKQSHLYAWFRKVGIDIRALRGKGR